VKPLHVAMFVNGDAALPEFAEVNNLNYLIMKREIYVGVFLALVGVSIVGCKKNVSQPTPKFDLTLNIATDGRMLIFKTTEDYNKVVNNPTEKERSVFISKVKGMKHTTYAEKLAITKSGESDDLIGDEYMSTILNEDWIVQIGDYLYRVNKPTESVYVLPAANIDEYQDLVDENKSNPHIRKFSTLENVIELAESGAEGQKSLFCGEDGCGPKESITDKYPIGTSGFEFWGYTDYNRFFGIYFSLTAWARSSAPNGYYRFYIQVENCWYHIKCGGTTGPYSHPWYQSEVATNNVQKFQSYSGSTPLNGLHLKIRIRCEIPNLPQGNNPYTTIFTNWSSICVNSPYC
jgi:hypothetical protein